MSETSGLRALPSVDRLLRDPLAAVLLERFDRVYVADVIRAELLALRERCVQGEAVPDTETILERVTGRIAADSPRLQRVINATGVVLHTNLGRAELAECALDAVMAAGGAVNLELDLDSGRRGERDDLLEDDLRHLCGSEAATVVNNNAAAVLLVLNTLAEGRAAIVSRGELIEIGGSFRIPEILAKSGCRLLEVGTTNRTRPADYESAIDADTGVLLKVHTSNYRIVGFTESTPLEELVEIGRRHGIPVVEDLGSGALVDLDAYGLPREPVVSERVALGADVVTFSGDKLLGGPQAGLIVGKRACVDAMRKNPLKRALRCDKLTLAALAATLRLYRRSPELHRDLPALRWLTRPLDEIDRLAHEAAEILRARLEPEHRVEVRASESEVGSGALPTRTIETRVVAISHPALDASAIAARFRAARPPVIGRVHEGWFLLDVRTVARAADLAVDLQRA